MAAIVKLGKGKQPRRAIDVVLRRDGIIRRPRIPPIRASCELWIKNRRDEGMKWRLGMTGVMRNRQRQGFEVR
ncbi:MAG: hypothetical protein QF586_02010 [Arenicellales bacterium]|nr:hypothetical protein [Arenicellales bacterium]